MKSTRRVVEKPLLKVPAEHGAVVALAVSSVVSWPIACSNPAVFLLSQCLLWLIVLTLHREAVSVSVAVAGGLLLALSTLNLWLLVIPVLVLAGHMALNSALWGIYCRYVREIGGMAGASLLPVLLAWASSGNDYLALLIGASLLGATFAASFIVHLATNQKGATAWTMLVISLGSWGWMLCCEPALFLALTLPFSAQILLMSRLKQLSFKRLGLLEATCMTWVTVALIIYDSIWCNL